MSSTFMVQSSKFDLKPKRHHGYSVVLFIMGTLFPPLAVAARFGIGKDFWLNLLLTICGYIPGHFHNFYIQNVRNNKNNRRTPKWAQRYGLIDTTTIERHKKRSQWAARYNDRLPHSALEGQQYEEGEVAPSLDGDGNSIDSSSRSNQRRNADGQYWNPEEETYYGQNGRGGDSRSVDSGGGGGRWHYPANFEDSLPPEGAASSGSVRKKKKKDRWARTEDVYSLPDGEVVDGGAQRKTKKKKKRSTKSHSTVGGADDGDSFNRRSGSTATTDFPEDAEGGLYGARPNGYGNGAASRDPQVPVSGGRQRDELDHEF